MIDWEEVIRAEDEDKLREVKLWLFRENIRLENERRELEQSRENFLNERVRLRNELDELNQRTLLERKRLKEENLFFDKKLAILKDGFRKLDEDRKMLERQKKALAQEKTDYDRKRLACADSGSIMEETVRMLFRGTDNTLALRKRYRDLVKVFHPDNMFGDEELVQMINREYLRRKREGNEDFLRR